jgi:MMPL family
LVLLAAIVFFYTHLAGPDHLGHLNQESSTYRARRANSGRRSAPEPTCARAWHLLSTLVIVAIIVLLVYRSPVLWLLPLITAVGGVELARAATHGLAPAGPCVPAPGTQGAEASRAWAGVGIRVARHPAAVILSTVLILGLACAGWPCCQSAAT